MAMAGRDNLPAVVSEVLAAVVLSIGGEAVVWKQIASLTMADRQWLMLNLAHILQEGGFWLKGYCDGCEQSFDLYIDPRQLPVKVAGEGFPFTELTLGKHRLLLRLPNGIDQECIAGLDTEEAVAHLLSACLLSVNDASVPEGYVDTLDSDAFKKIEEALDKVSPYVGTVLATSCPECKRPQQIEINPYLLSAAKQEALLQEVHMLASAYHWSESEILSLSRDRRRFYLKLIERSRNVVV
ncbi:MAG: hypothetical protein FWD46_06625 [Cystobacterineae bacterium]|nr:hypothetical protein [Cystobacterineae bacterium]